MGKQTEGKNRHVLVDTPGLTLHAIVHPANIRGRDGGGLVLQTLFGRFLFLTKALRRWRLPGTGLQRRGCEGHAQSGGGNCEAFGYGERVGGSAEALGCRT